MWKLIPVIPDKEMEKRKAKQRIYNLGINNSNIEQQQQFLKGNYDPKTKIKQKKKHEKYEFWFFLKNILNVM